MQLPPVYLMQELSTLRHLVQLLLPPVYSQSIDYFFQLPYIHDNEHLTIEIACHSLPYTLENVVHAINTALDLN